MSRHLNFTQSKDKVPRANTYLEFRLSADEIAWFCAGVAAERECNPRLVSKAEIEKEMRETLRYRGMDCLYQYSDDDHASSLYDEALAHVKGIYGVNN